MPLLLHNAEHWRTRAREARIAAERIVDPRARQTMLEIARDYERMADRAEAQVVSEQDDR